MGDLPARSRPGEQRGEANRALAQLRDDGWIDARGEIHERLESALLVLGQARHAVDTICHVGSPTRAVLAASGRRGVLVIAAEEQVSVHRISPHGLGGQAATLLPNVPAGHGRSVTVPTAMLEAATRDASDDLRLLHSALQRRGIRRDTAHLVTVMNQGVINTAQFGVTAATGDGRRMRRGDHVVGWWQNSSGGYLAEQHRSSSGESWTTIAPTDVVRLAQQIERQLDSLLRTVHK
jgi:hypothetical protein